MKYLCLVYLEQDKLHAVPDRECQACGDGLRKSGLLVAAEALEPIETATTVRVRNAGIVGAVVTLMGLLALPAMLRAGYSVQLSAGAITAGGCLGILIPPSVLLIVYGATAGVSVVKLYAGAFFPGLMLAGAVRGLRRRRREAEAASRAAAERKRAAGRPAADLASAERRSPQRRRRAVRRTAHARAAAAIGLRPAVRDAAAGPRRSSPCSCVMYGSATAPVAAVDTTGLVQAGSGVAAAEETSEPSPGLQEPPMEGATDSTGVKEPEALGAAAAPAATPSAVTPAAAPAAGGSARRASGGARARRRRGSGSSSRAASPPCC